MSALDGPIEAAVVDALGAITTAALAQILGKRDPRAARDWCKRHGVALRRDGKHNWVDIGEVRRVLAQLPATRAPGAVTGRDDAVFDAAATLMRRK